jgi:hypothetical protein
MARNVFEQVDEAPDDALTLLIGKQGDELMGAVNCPASATAGQLVKDYASGGMPAKEAFRSAIQLANKLKVPIVVMDPQGVWDREWGDLRRTDAEP